MYGKGFLGNMTENLQADCVQSRQAGFMQCFLYNSNDIRSVYIDSEVELEPYFRDKSREKTHFAE